MTVRVRFAPSPTGPLHIGGARTALFNYLFARREGGTFILRLEDTDVARSTIEYEHDVLENLHWLGIDWDEGPGLAGQPGRGSFGPYRQMERLDRYNAAIERLMSEDKAYPCYCTPDELSADREVQQAANQPVRYVGRCASLSADDRRAHESAGRRPAVRFRIGQETIVIDDLVRGRVEIDTSALGGDLVIARSDGSPLYHFSVVVDDIDMRISHVIRGEEHLSNTPKHVLLFGALGADVPAFAHLPLILNPDRTKMSKRKSQTAVTDYRAQGFVHEALVNYFALLGWSSGTEEEIFSLDELAERFDLSRVQSAGAVFDRERLEWLNGQWIRRLPEEELVDRALPFLQAEIESARAAGVHARIPTADDLRPLIPMVRERIPTLDAVGSMLDYLFLDDVRPDLQLLTPKRWDEATTCQALSEAREVIAQVGEVSFEADELEGPLRLLAERHGWKAGDLFMAIRVAATGRTATPPLFDTLVALGYQRTLDRLGRAAARLTG
ncbi:MAG TPA: glutamate--tRNA ligase [Candidatus Limnocylindrales bacterium]|nr:glutamate--tRNA ligase [Candidatus Limnocylindrales bacterium]